MTRITDNPILTLPQKEFLSAFRKTRLKEAFYLTGGTALSAFYLRHRYSDGLDYFSEQEIALEDILAFIHSLRDIRAVRVERKFGRKLFLIDYPDQGILKVEFTRYPFRRIASGEQIEGVSLDSLVDILVNKLVALTDRKDPKDFVDVYAIFLGRPELDFSRMIGAAEDKFGVRGIGHILQGRFLDKIPSIDGLELIHPVSPEALTRFCRDHAERLIRSSLDDG